MEARDARNAAAAAMETELNACRGLYPNENQRPVMPRMRCMTDAWIKFSRAGQGLWTRHLDLDELLRAKALALAEEYDAGKLTEAQFVLQKAQAITDHNSQIAQRENSAKMVAAAQEQASAASMQAIASTAPRTCAVVGNVVNCF
jgi:hypothetical protein